MDLLLVAVGLVLGAGIGFTAAWTGRQLASIALMLAWAALVVVGLLHPDVPGSLSGSFAVGGVLGYAAAAGVAYRRRHLAVRA
ncbi:hypothetical protein [Cellulomonas fimi]|uniref:hypothetical protein n=1 Tax=Cellulomonas fimi TaxID=1708 RepID=UPI00235A1A29|nr:hypothetical protein [Cellulomonas fimi]